LLVTNKTKGKPPALILDTKWKCLKSDEEDRKNGVSQADMYQMYAYAKRFDCNNTILLYPETADVIEKTYCLLEDENKKIRIKTINLNMDLMKMRDDFKQNIFKIIDVNEENTIFHG